jgi:preprotein translocase subunit SecY
MKPELARRISFTLGALIVYRLGTYIPVPGLDPNALPPLFRTQWPLGTGIHRLAIFALDIVPYVTAAVMVQLVTLVFRRRPLDGRGEQASRAIERATLILTALFVMFQSLGIAFGLERLNVVSEPGLLFRISTTATLTGGTFFLIWLSRQITLRGVGNGLALILFVSIAVEVPASIPVALEFGRRGVHESNLVLGLLFLLAAVVVLIVLMESARRRVPIEYAGRQVGAQAIELRASVLSLKLNNAGIIPVAFASWLLYPPLVLATLVGDQDSWLGGIIEQFAHGRPAYMIYTVLAVVILALLYTAFILDPVEVTEKLKRYGGRIPGIEPGEPTAEHVDRVLSRTALLGAIYLAFVCLIPELLIAHAPVPFYFGGVPALIVVSTVLDIDQQIRVEALA